MLHLNPATDRKRHLPLARLFHVHLVFATAGLILMARQYAMDLEFQYLVLGLAILCFMAIQVLTWFWVKAGAQRVAQANWIIVCTVLVSTLVMPLLIQEALPACLFLLAAIPLYVAVTEQLKQLPSALFLIFVAFAATLLLDLATAHTPWRLLVDSTRLWGYAGAAFVVYAFCLGVIFHRNRRHRADNQQLRINVATQYALFITAISALVITLVTGVLTSQIRNAQIDQVGRSFQTIAENVAKLVGSHLEQQTQKLQMLTQQVPTFKQRLLASQMEYAGSRDAAHRLLAERDRLWSGPDQDEDFIMQYRNNAIIRALNRFRGHNSFHYDIMLVDRYGGLVASLGKKPEHFYSHDRNWWKITWNGGLGNIFIGDLKVDKRSRVPRLRIAVDIIDRNTNEVIGMLSSSYSLRTLLEDIQRFKPDTVDQISLTDANGQVIASTAADVGPHKIWPRMSDMATPSSQPGSAWDLGRDHLDQTALIGYSTLSTAYNVISDPLQRLGWHVVVSGTRSNALLGVTRSTKLAILAGLVAMALGILGAIAAARVITRPIENLTATASAMGEGDLNNRARLEGPEELVALSAGFNQLTDRLHTVIQDLKSQTAELARAKMEAEAATQLKGEFLANMSHEIRTPLNAILGFADILESSIEDRQQKRHAQTIKTSGTDLLHLINDILDLSRIEAGRMEIQAGAVNLSQMFNELQRIFSISAERKRIRMEMRVDGDVPAHLWLDRARLRQVLFNLIGNAVKFTHQGSVQCTAGVRSTGLPNAWDLVIEVRDTGIGIDPSAHTAIFETFRQHHGDAQSSVEGSGLGLTISKSLIEMMGGRIAVDGTPDEGTLFTIHIPGVLAVEPAISSAGDHDAEAVQTAVMRFEPATILVADDLKTNRRLIAESLKSQPLTIEEAADGRTAVTQALNHPFDLILMDLRMPGMDGYGAFKRIRNDRHSVDVPVVAITAAGMKEDIDRIQAAGFDDHLIRPFSQDALLSLLARFLPQDTTRQTGRSGDRESLTADLRTVAEPPWRCPPEAEEQLLTVLAPQWRQVIRKQSMPEIITFAQKVNDAGRRFDINVLTRYGAELAEYAEAFDIQKVEKLLKLFEAILDQRVAETAAARNRSGPAYRRRPS